jgi:PAS domain S-box-containing protein
MRLTGPHERSHFDKTNSKRANRPTNRHGSTTYDKTQMTGKTAMNTEEAYKSLVNHIDIGIFRTTYGDPDRFLEVNPAMEEITGYSKQELLMMCIADLYVHSEEWAEISRQVLSGESNESREILIKKKDGIIIVVRTKNVRVTVNDGHTAYLEGFIENITGYKNAETALKSERENLYNSMDTSPLGIEIFNSKGQLIYANHTILEMWGYRTFEEFLQVTIKKAFTPFSVALIHKLFRERESNIAPAPYELTLVCSDGRLREVRVYSKQAIWNGEKCVQMLYEDITEHKRDEDIILFKNALLEAQAETATEGMLVVDENNKIILHNKRFQEIWQIPPELIETKDDTPVLNYVASQIADSDTVVQEAHYLYQHLEETAWRQRELKDGRMIERYSCPLIDVNGIYRGRVWYFRDITESTRMRRMLEHAAGEWRTTFDSIDDLISIQDRNSRLLRVNKAFARMFSKTPQILIGKACCELVHGTQSCPENCPTRQTLKTGKPAFLETYEPIRGIWFDESTYPILGNDNKIIGTVNIIRDISTRKQMEHQMAMTDRLASIGELVSGISHELNNPLTSVIGFSQLLMEKEVDEETKSDLTIIYDEAQRAARIVKDLLTFARKHLPVKQPNQINRIIEDVLKLRTYEQKVNNIEVIQRLDAELPEIMVDFFQMQQVFINIIINAEYFMIEAHKQGKLTITTERKDNNIRISIADDGPGILPENLKKLFNPFFTTKEVGKGTGLGLSICHGIVTEHGGKIYVESEPGKGATFVIELPINAN